MTQPSYQQRFNLRTNLALQLGAKELEQHVLCPDSLQDGRLPPKVLTLAEHKASLHTGPPLRLESGSPPPTVTSLTGNAVTQVSDDPEPIVYRRRILLVDEHGQPLLWRLSPRNLSAKKAMAAAAQEGKKLFQQMVAECKAGNQGRKTRDGVETRGGVPVVESTPDGDQVVESTPDGDPPHPDAATECFSLGYWYSQAGYTWHGPSSDLLQGNVQARQETAASFLYWWRNYMMRFIEPILSTSDTPAPWRAACESRKEAMNWNRERWPSAGTLCPQFFSVCTVFNKYTPGPHEDGHDHTPSCLLNFGADSWLHLPKLQAEILLKPFDICVADTRVLTHSTSRPAWTDGEARWACSGYFQSGLLDPLKRPVATHKKRNLEKTAVDVEKRWRSRLSRSHKKGKPLSMMPN